MAKIDSYEVEVLVNGKPVQEYLHENNLYIEGKENTEFSLRLKNNTGTRTLFIPTIDGLSVLDGKEASFKSRGYIVDPYSSESIEGWRTSDSEVAKFFFSKIGESYAAKSGKDGNVGVIGCAVFKEKEKQYVPIVVKYHHFPHHWGCGCGACWWVTTTTTGGTGITILGNGNTTLAGNTTATNALYNLTSSNTSMNASATGSSAMMQAKQNMADNALGTGFGELKRSQSYSVDFERQSETPSAVFVLHYNTRKNLEAMGVQFKRPVYISPSAFPNESGFCKPPTKE